MLRVVSSRSVSSLGEDDDDAGMTQGSHMFVHACHNACFAVQGNPTNNITG